MFDRGCDQCTLSIAVASIDNGVWVRSGTYASAVYEWLAQLGLVEELSCAVPYFRVFRALVAIEDEPAVGSSESGSPRSSFH